MSKPLPGIGSWAAAAEAEDEELAAAAAAAAESSPTLQDSVTTKPRNKKMSLAEFSTSNTGLGGGGSRADEVDAWSRGGVGGGGGGGGGPPLRSGSFGRTKLVLDKPTGAGKGPEMAENKGGLENGVKGKAKVNPFGDAKPREVVLEGKGQDWRKMDRDFEHRVLDRTETEEEKTLKKEIALLKKELHNEVPTDASQERGADQASLDNLIQLKENELENLTRELDDKVRIGQKAVERPGSGAGRSGSFLERPASQSRYFDDARNMDSAGGPRSRGTGDPWSRPAEDRRGSFHGGRDRGFLSGGDFDRSGSRPRW